MFCLSRKRNRNLGGEAVGERAQLRVLGVGGGGRGGAAARLRRTEPRELLLALLEPRLRLRLPAPLPLGLRRFDISFVSLEFFIMFLCTMRRATLANSHSSCCKKFRNYLYC